VRNAHWSYQNIVLLDDAAPPRISIGSGKNWRWKMRSPCRRFRRHDELSEALTAYEADAAQLVEHAARRRPASSGRGNGRYFGHLEPLQFAAC
jgi:hypothetical protein